MQIHTPLKLICCLLCWCALARADEPQLDHTFGPSPFSTQALAFSPDAKKLAVVGSDGVKIYETATGKVLETRPVNSSYPTSVTWSPDGKMIAASGLTREIMLWRDGQKTLRWQTARSYITGLVFSPDSKQLASAGGGESLDDRGTTTACLWDVATGKLLHTLACYPVGDGQVAFSPSGNRVLLDV